MILSIVISCIICITPTLQDVRFLSSFVNNITNQNMTIQCYNDGDCSYNGYCDAGLCHCSVAYDTLLLNANTTSSAKYCNYKKKSQLTAFLLSFFVGFGAEHFYLERNNTAAAKIVFYALCCALNLVYFILSTCVKNGKRFTEFIGTFEAFYLSCGFLYMLLWNIYDWVKIGFNTLPDGNGIQMLPWNRTLYP